MSNRTLYNFMTIYFKMPFLLSKHTVEFNTLLMSKDFRIVTSRHIIVISHFQIYSWLSLLDCPYEAIIWISCDQNVLLIFFTVCFNRLWSKLFFLFCGYFFRGTVDDTELVEGLVLEQKISHLAGGISQVEKAKIGLIQFCISPPKTDVSDI